MTALSRAEAASVLIDHWDDLSLAQKLMRIRCLRGRSVSDRLVPSEDTMRRADALVERGAVTDGADVSLSSAGGVIIGWGSAPDYVVWMCLNHDGTTTVEVEMPGSDPLSYGYPPGAYHDEEAARRALDELSVWPLVPRAIDAVLP